MIVLGLVLLVIGVALMLLVPEPMVGQIGRLVAFIGAVLLVVGVVLLALDGHHLHEAMLRL